MSIIVAYTSKTNGVALMIADDKNQGSAHPTDKINKFVCTTGTFVYGAVGNGNLMTFATYVTNAQNYANLQSVGNLNDFLTILQRVSSDTMRNAMPALEKKAVDAPEYAGYLATLKSQKSAMFVIDIADFSLTKVEFGDFSILPTADILADEVIWTLGWKEGIKHPVDANKSPSMIFSVMKSLLQQAHQENAEVYGVPGSSYEHYSGRGSLRSVFPDTLRYFQKIYGSGEAAIE
ncbi:MAG: hypothetical protein ACOY5B_18830 [Spirochaetota bacterium]